MQTNSELGLIESLLLVMVVTLKLALDLVVGKCFVLVQFLYEFDELLLVYQSVTVRVSQPEPLFRVFLCCFFVNIFLVLKSLFYLLEEIPLFFFQFLFVPCS